MILIIYFLLIAEILFSGCSQAPTVPIQPSFSSSETPTTEKKQFQMLNRQMTLEKLKLMSSKPESDNKFLKGSQEFSISLPTNKPYVSRQKDWNYSYITVFSKHPEKVDQIAITTINCKMPSDIAHFSEIRARMLSQIKNVSRSLWGQGFELNEEIYFKELGHHLEKPSRVYIRETFEPVSKMQLSRGIFKCDGAGGYGLRYDFFPN